MNAKQFMKRIMATGALAGVVSLAACDLSVSNPGPVQDATLNLEGAYQGIINGAKRSVQEGFDQYALLGGSIVHDLMPSGHTGAAGVQVVEEIAAINAENNGAGGDWFALHRGRWIAEEAIRRFTDPEIGVSDPSSFGLIAQAHFWAGAGTRYLGENACTAVFDGGAPEPKLAHFDYAINHFDQAATVARNSQQDKLATAAIGMRAAAKLFKGDYSGAAADAGQVPFDFVFQTEYTGFGNEFYILYGHVLSEGFQSLSYWGTPAGDHFLSTGDARVAFGYDNGSWVSEDGGNSYTRQTPGSGGDRAQNHPARPTWTALVPMFYPLKGISPRIPEQEFYVFAPDRAKQREDLQVDLVDGREMELVLAEVELRNGNWQAAMTHINKVRTSAAVYPIDMTDPVKFDLTLHPAEQKDWDANPEMEAYFNQFAYELKDFTQGDNMMVGDVMMDAVVATSAEEAWAALKFERLIELTLEGRRLGDRWRWRKNSEPVAPSSGPGGENAPGEYHSLEFIPPSHAERYNVPTDPLNLCFPLPVAENDANSNVPEEYVDWVARP